MTLISEIDKDVDYWLRQFARLDRVNDEVRRLGYPSRSPCFIPGGESRRWDDFADEAEASAWKQHAKAMGAIVEDLPQVHKTVIEIIYLGRKNIWDYPESMLIDTLKDAEPGIIVAMRKRNII